MNSFERIIESPGNCNFVHLFIRLVHYIIEPNSISRVDQFSRPINKHELSTQTVIKWIYQFCKKMWNWEMWTNTSLY